jgi:hypothetical protein
MRTVSGYPYLAMYALFTACFTIWLPWHRAQVSPTSPVWPLPPQRGQLTSSISLCRAGPDDRTPISPDRALGPEYRRLARVERGPRS